MKLEEIIKTFSLDKKDLAEKLFPDNKYPELALKRVIRDDLYLNADQLETLSSITKQTVSDLINANAWKAKTSKEGVHTFEKENYTAELDSMTMITSIYCKSRRVHEELISAKGITLSDYFELLNNAVKKIETNEN